MSEKLDTDPRPLSELIEEWLKEHPEAPIPEYVRDGEQEKEKEEKEE